MSGTPGGAKPKQSNKPTGKGSRGPYKKTLQKQQAAALGRNVGSLSPIGSSSSSYKSKSKSNTPKPSTGKKRKKGDDDGMGMSRGSSRANSLVGGSSRGGTPNDDSDIDEDDLDLDDDEEVQAGSSQRRRTDSRRPGGAGSGSDDEDEDEEDEEDQGDEEDSLFEIGVIRKRLKANKDSQMSVLLPSSRSNSFALSRLCPSLMLAIVTPSSGSWWIT